MSKDKRGKNHHSFPKDLKFLFKFLNNCQEVKKIIIGKSTGISHELPTGYIRFIDFVNSGIKIRATSNKGIMDIFVYCDKSEKENIKNKIISLNNISIKNVSKKKKKRKKEIINDLFDESLRKEFKKSITIWDVFEEIKKEKNMRG